MLDNSLIVYMYNINMSRKRKRTSTVSISSIMSIEQDRARRLFKEELLLYKESQVPSLYKLKTRHWDVYK